MRSSKQISETVVLAKTILISSLRAAEGPVGASTDRFLPKSPPHFTAKKRIGFLNVALTIEKIELGANCFHCPPPSENPGAGAFSARPPVDTLASQHGTWRHSRNRDQRPGGNSPHRRANDPRHRSAGAANQPRTGPASSRPGGNHRPREEAAGRDDEALGLVPGIPTLGVWQGIWAATERLTLNHRLGTHSANLRRHQS